MPPDRLKDEEGRLAALRRYDVADSLGEGPVQRVVELVQDMLEVPAAAVTLLDADREWIRSARGIAAEFISRRDAFCDETIRRYEPLIVADAHDDWRFARNPMVTGAPYVRSYLGVPLTTPDGYNIGSLCAFDTSPREFTEREARILGKCARLVVEQLELQQVARQDSMTGALTRSGFLAEVDKEFTRAIRYDRPSALVMIDVDHFRTINDRYGHPAGDAVLVSIATACMSSMRKSDILGRIGGEEFGLLLPETGAEDAREAADRIRRAVESTIVEAGGAAIRATISLGVAPIPAASEGAGGWLAEADIALYEAKQFGRNRVVLGKPRRPAPLPTDMDQQSKRPN